MSYTNTDFRCTMKCNKNDVGASNPLELEWNKKCDLYGFSPDDLHKKVRLDSGVHEIIGLKPSNRKYPIITRNINNNKQYKHGTTSILRALGKYNQY